MPPHKHQELLTAAIECEREAQQRLIDGHLEAAQAEFREVAELYRRSWEAAHARAFGRLVGMLKGFGVGRRRRGGGRVRTGRARRGGPGLGDGQLRAGDRGAHRRRRRRCAGLAALLSEATDAFARAGEAISALAAHDEARYAAALEAIVRDFEERSQHLTGVAIADTALMLETLAARRGMAAGIESPVLPAR